MVHPGGTMDGILPSTASKRKRLRCMGSSSRKLLITAGPTHEPIDAVRYIANRSSGKLGVALAAAGVEAAGDVTLLLGPVELQPPKNVATHRFTTASDLEGLLGEHFPPCDVLIMAAAVADYRARPAGVPKLPRTNSPLVLELEATPDLLASCAKRKGHGQVLIGFALEPSDGLVGRAMDKLRRKGVDAIVANPLETMGADRIDARMIFADGRTAHAGVMGKGDFARWLM